MSIMKLRLIHATSVITEVAEKMQPILRDTCFLSMRLIVDINPLREDLLYPFQQTDGPPHRDSISHGKGTLETTNTAAWHHSIDKSASTSGDRH